jgi:hypothetical protein
LSPGESPAISIAHCSTPFPFARWSCGNHLSLQYFSRSSKFSMRSHRSFTVYSALLRSRHCSVAFLQTSHGHHMFSALWSNSCASRGCPTEFFFQNLPVTRFHVLVDQEWKKREGTQDSNALLSGNTHHIEQNPISVVRGCDADTKQRVQSECAYDVMNTTSNRDRYLPETY